MNFQSIISGIRDKIGGLFQPPKMISPLPDNYQLPPQATPTPQPAVLGARAQTQRPVTEEQIKRGWDNQLWFSK